MTTKMAAISKRIQDAQRYSQRAAKSVCTCGHHGDGNASWHAGSGPARGHGYCIHAGCSCKKFTWAHWTPAYNEYMASRGHWSNDGKRS